MKALKRPAGGYEWEQPGYRFSIDWPPGFVSQIGEGEAVDRSAISAKNRAAQLAQGNTGSIRGLSARADELTKKYIEAIKTKSKKRGGQ